MVAVKCSPSSFKPMGINMKKRYLETGESIYLHFIGQVGPSGTLVDLRPDQTAMLESMGELRGPGGGVGTIVRDGYTSDVYVEAGTGRLWHDDDAWY